jgi:CDP-diacylglycerol--serine O-phosphatidyltransferase
MLDDPGRPAWAASFFVGVPAPAGAIIVLLPIYLHFLGMPLFVVVPPLIFVYTLAIAFLMVSKLPVFSGKKLGTRVSPDMVLPVFLLVALFFALLLSYPWEILTIGSLCYLISLPFGWLSYREQERKAAESTSSLSGLAVGASETLLAPPQTRVDDPDQERRTRLN